MKQLILASKSPRRREILETLGISFTVRMSDADESSEERDPERLVEELAERKGRALLAHLEKTGEMCADTVILSSDTVVAVDGEILGKPRDEADARRMLRLLSGRTHRVISGVCFLGHDAFGVSHEVTEVEFAPMSEEDIDYYLSSCEPYDKAGAYAIQGKAAAWIRGIHGDYFNVVGLPVHRTCVLYREIFGENFR